MCQNVVLVVWDSSTVTMAEMWVSFVKVYKVCVTNESAMVRVGIVMFVYLQPDK